ncbi:DUF4328 domain-containing protein [Mycobacterium botniense]|uniref:Membrane protein n=1 Tax=Mycobacterium botniense TaxID=84962 RepID=A0A7I9XUL0_9MYCO|nr:DUF4328 domain-containing protein [Mycobacterium botniense]GFG72657.1 membrane protein [Mycobacterium botniense]GFG73693.1 membrane protein [Mycobacterium botniense]
MIQVCSQCGTRWNVRDRQRMWCPRCRGALLAPLPEADPRWSAQGPTQAPVTASQRPAPQLPPGYRWIAVRPGAPPPRRPPRKPLGPTPRYTVIPRWSLADQVGEAAQQRASPVRQGPPATTVHTTLFATLVVFAIAALVYVVRYVLLVINRNTLLNPLVAAAAVWLGVGVSLAAIAAVIACAVVLIRWLIARRAAAFMHYGRHEPRPGWSLWAGCLVPLVNLAWAPVYVIELAMLEKLYARLRRPILMWWIVWIASTGVSVFAIATSRAHDAQGIANNTVAMTLGYLLAAATLATLVRVFDGFERKPIERPAHRWVVVPVDGQGSLSPAATVELQGREPAA